MSQISSPMHPLTLLSSESRDELQFRIEKLIEIGIALSSERDLDSLLERILSEARRLTRADAGTVYLLMDDGTLHFKVMHNESKGFRLGGTSDNPIPEELRPVAPDENHVSGFVALKGETINIADVYTEAGFDFSGTRRYDQQIGYRSRSMLVAPMKNHEAKVTGVLQLINARATDSEEVAVFRPEIIRLIEALASQAAIALTNARLIYDLNLLFEALVRVIAKVVDIKDPTTAGHIERVTRLSVLLAESVNEANQGELAEYHFTKDEIKELQIAGWLHDIGKLTVPDQILNKGKKLEILFDRIELIKERFETIKSLRKMRFIEEKIALIEAGESERIQEAENRFLLDRGILEGELDFVIECNAPVEYLPDEQIEKLSRIAIKTYRDVSGEERSYLTDEEYRNLSVRRGSFTKSDFELMRNHVIITSELLNIVPFPKELMNVPLYAGQHHELLDGSGYPLSMNDENLPLQSRILTICDIFDALTMNRPYKKGFSLETSLKILTNEMNGKVDQRLVELFIQNRLWERAGLYQRIA